MRALDPSRVLTASEPFGTQQMLSSQATFESFDDRQADPQATAFMTSTQVPVPTNMPFATQALGASPTGSVNLGGSTIPISGRPSEYPQVSSRSGWSMPATGISPQGQLRSLPSDRIAQMAPSEDPGATLPMGSSGPGTASNTYRMHPTAAPPAMFTTAAVPQMQAQDSTIGADSHAAGTEEENEFLQQRVQQLEQDRETLQQQLAMQQQGPSQRDLQHLEQRVREAEAAEDSARNASNDQANQIHHLEQELQRLRAGGASEGQHVQELQYQLQQARSAEGAYKQQVEDQQARLQELAQEIQRVRQSEAQANAQLQQQRQMQGGSVNPELERKTMEYRQLEDAFDNHKLEIRKQISDMQDVLESEQRSKDFHQQQSAQKDAQLRQLQEELTYRKNAEIYNKKQGELHRKEALRLKRLREEDAPPKPPQRMPLKGLEERIMQLACFMMLGVCALPILGAIAVLSDDNYQFWLGTMWPWLVIGGCVFTFILFGVTMQGLLHYALPEYRSQFTMAFTWATFAALLGVILVPLSLMANKEALNIASTISQGCLTAMPQSELLVDYSQVLYNIRLSQNCSGATSVTECNGWAENKYTTYLQYLETEFQCGPLCPESPPPARVVHSPSLHNTPMPTIKPTLPPPPLIGPPLQGATAFLQADDSLVSHRSNVHRDKASRQLAIPAGSGVMETALPHMQAQKLFSEGKTRMTCYPLIATRLQVLVSTFGGLWYWEGMGLIIISLLTSIYAGLYFALGMA